MRPSVRPGGPAGSPSAVRGGSAPGRGRAQGDGERVARRGQDLLPVPRFDRLAPSITASRVAGAAVERSWVIRTRQSPLRRRIRAAGRSSSARRPTGSRPEVISSQTSTRGRARRARARAARRGSPPESSPGRRRTCSSPRPSPVSVPGLGRCLGADDALKPCRRRRHLGQDGPVFVERGSGVLEDVPHGGELDPVRWRRLRAGPSRRAGSALRGRWRGRVPRSWAPALPERGAAGGPTAGRRAVFRGGVDQQIAAPGECDDEQRGHHDGPGPDEEPGPVADRTHVIDTRSHGHMSRRQAGRTSASVAPPAGPEWNCLQAPGWARRPRRPTRRQLGPRPGGEDTR
ncbi:hypothetical protein GA0115239_10593 [Streptomyces sp. BpilaLS-43]|nr:hypothetical protein GA0115239_10593 [Streptomyces sp. BpilaLS-43]